MDTSPRLPTSRIAAFLRTPSLARSVTGLLALAFGLLLVVNVATFVMIQRTASMNDQIEQAQAIAMPLDRFHLFRGQQALAHGISLVQLRRSRTHDAPRTAKKKPGSRPNRAFYLDMAGNSEASHPGREC